MNRSRLLESGPTDVPLAPNVVKPCPIYARTPGLVSSEVLDVHGMNELVLSIQ